MHGKCRSTWSTKGNWPALRGISLACPLSSGVSELVRDYCPRLLSGWKMGSMDEYIFDVIKLIAKWHAQIYLALPSLGAWFVRVRRKVWVWTMIFCIFQELSTELRHTQLSRCNWPTYPVFVMSSEMGRIFSARISCKMRQIIGNMWGIIIG